MLHAGAEGIAYPEAALERIRDAPGTDAVVPARCLSSRLAPLPRLNAAPARTRRRRLSDSGTMPERPLLAVSSGGGHLTELIDLAPRIAGGRPIAWTTFDTPQSRSALHGEDVTYVRAVSTRQLARLLWNIAPAFRILRAQRPELVVSTGSGIAVPFLLLARLLGIPAHYIECATRSQGPSVSGALLARVPGIRTYTQNPGWANGRWLHRGSAFDGFASGGEDPPAPLRRVVVTVGTNPYSFRRLLERMVAILPEEVEVVWQTGVTDVSGLPVDAHPMVPAHVLERAMREADVVIAHAGTGSALSALQAGKIPVLVPRRAAYDEQIDDHQIELARWLESLGLAYHVDADDLNLPMLEHARRKAIRLEVPPRFEVA